jgi:hypothetical protein
MKKIKVFVSSAFIAIGTNAMAAINPAHLGQIELKVTEAGKDSVSIGLSVLSVFVLVLGIKFIRKWF